MYTRVKTFKNKHKYVRRVTRTRGTPVTRTSTVRTT